MWEIQACLDFTHVAGGNEDWHPKLGWIDGGAGGGHDKLRGWEPCLFIQFLVLDAVHVSGGVMGRCCAASSHFKAKSGPANPRWILSFPSKADS